MNNDDLTNLDILNQPGFFNTIKLALRMHGFWKSLALFILLQEEQRRFIASAQSESERSCNKYLLSQFKKIHNNVSCPHSPFQFALVSRYLFACDVKGPIVIGRCNKTFFITSTGL